MLTLYVIRVSFVAPVIYVVQKMHILLLKLFKSIHSINNIIITYILYERHRMITYSLQSNTLMYYSNILYLPIYWWLLDNILIVPDNVLYLHIGEESIKVLTYSSILITKKKSTLILSHLVI